jgi:hypothetical protein
VPLNLKSNEKNYWFYRRFLVSIERDKNRLNVFIEKERNKKAAFLNYIVKLEHLKKYQKWQHISKARK